MTVNFALKYQAIAEKTANTLRGLFLPHLVHISSRQASLAVSRRPIL